MKVDATDMQNALSWLPLEGIAAWWWLIGLAVAIAIVRRSVFGTRSRRQRGTGRSTKSGRRQRRPAFRAESPNRTISGRAYVTDGDGLRVARKEVRLAGLDAPEWDQRAKHQDGYWFNHGKRVKSALIKEIGGKHVTVSVEGTDRFGRLLGTVTYEGGDIGEWLVREGHAIAAYSERYRHVEREARKAKRGMWAHAHNIDPRVYRHGTSGKG